jgi:hypothetical protein
MVRCGNCGLFSAYPDPKGQSEGVCTYYQIVLSRDDTWKKRECDDFIIKLPEVSTLDHFSLKVTRDGLGDAYKEAKRARKLSNVALVLSVVSLVSGLIW